ncbi:MAG TPA: hypothetical protein VGM03_15135 [Phycisphaerae bacterium]
MIWILATRGAGTKLRASPFTETAIEGVHSVVYRPGIAPVAGTGASGAPPLGTFTRGLVRISGVVFSYHGSAAETLLGITSAIDLIVRYRADGQRRKRMLLDVIFLGDATVVFPALNSGLSELIGVPFRVQIPEGETLADHVVDAADT